jgi:hypothetical protein
MPDVTEPQILGITHGTNPLTGDDQFTIEFGDGSQQTHSGSWVEARELAERARLDHIDYGPAGTTRWSQR